MSQRTLKEKRNQGRNREDCFAVALNFCYSTVAPPFFLLATSGLHVGYRLELEASIGAGRIPALNSLEIFCGRPEQSLGISLAYSSIFSANFKYFSKFLVLGSIRSNSSRFYCAVRRSTGARYLKHIFLKQVSFFIYKVIYVNSIA